MNLKTTGYLVALAATMLAATAAQADFTYSTDFSAGEGFSAGNLQFQNDWVGQNNAQVDPAGSGVVNANGAFFRNLYRNGAFGSVAGSGTDGVGPGAAVGDKISIDMEYQFDLDTRANRNLNRTGVRENFSTGGFDAAPKIGLKSFYSDFNSGSGGSLKLFGDVSRNGFSGADNAFALITSGTSVGLDPDGANGPVDLESDVLRYTLEMTYLGSDQWQTSALSLTNVTAGNLLLLDAATDKPAILMEVQTLAAGDFYLASTWTDSAIDVASDSISFTYTQAIPEPASLALFGLGCLGLMGTRRRV